MVAHRTNHYRAAWISNIHLGTRGSNATARLDFLKENEFDTLYVVVDLIDIWSLGRGIYWPQEHNKGTRVIYIPGNHDESLGGHLGGYGAITIQKHAIHLTAVEIFSTSTSALASCSRAIRRTPAAGVLRLPSAATSRLRLLKTG